MPSIRRSLIAYFLILLGVALAAVGVLVDRFAGEAMRAREKAEADRIEQEYTYRVKESETKFDEDIERQATAVGKEFRLHRFLISLRERGRDRNREPREWEKRYQSSMGAVQLAGMGGGWADLVLAGVATNRWVRGSVYNTMERNHVDDQLRLVFAESTEAHPKYYQFHYPWSRKVIRSSRQPVELPPLPIDEYNAASTTDFVRYGPVMVGGERVRRVVIKAPMTGGPFRWYVPELGRVAAGTDPAAPPVLPDPLPFIYVQVGQPLGELNQILESHAAKRQADQEQLAVETREAMTGLRVKLALIGGLTFVALAVGGWLLVGRGIAPIRKLSDAVSRVSEKDFRLPVRQEDLSLELLPIHGRLTQTLDELRRAFDREKQSVADISHELKTPLAALLTSLDVSLRKPRSAEQYKATMLECRDVGRQLGRLVDRIMTLASLDAGNDRVTSERVDASDVATECAIVIRPLVEAHGLTLATAIDSDAEMVTDPDKLREVLNNLLGNAIEYNRPGGSVELRVSADRGQVTFAVRDTGIGMTPEVRARIFERFYRADPSRTQTGVHAGLGLAIVTEYVERLGGTIAVESEPGVGSTFRVTLPTNGIATSDGNGSVGRSGYTPSLAPRTRTAAGAD